MENYIVSARKYRPATFDEVVGQQALTTTLKNAIATGKLAHAYLFCGPRGVGKTTCARIFAKTINCLHPKPGGEACGECESCRSFDEQRSYNIHELDAASNNSVEDIRQLIEQVRIPPQVGKYKVFIIDEVHMLSSAAFNAFLKTLEEPPAHAIFILATRSGSQGAESGISGGWAGFRSTGNLVRTFEFPSDDESTWTPDNIMDKRGIFYNNNGAVALDITTNRIETFDNEGWAVYKFTNIGSDGNPGKNSTFPDMDFPLFRLGEIYLNYAEAVARGGQGGNMSQAVNYINALRDRGYGDTNHRISENWLTASATIGGTNTSVAYGNLLNERQREMYFECTRRTDLIRYGLYTGNSYIWVDKGGVITGVGTDSHFDLYPIPTTDISVNANLEQNPGY